MSVLFVLLLSLRELLIFVHLYHLKVQVDTHNSATVHVHAVYCIHALQLYLPAIRSALTNDSNNYGAMFNIRAKKCLANCMSKFESTLMFLFYTAFGVGCLMEEDEVWEVSWGNTLPGQTDRQRCPQGPGESMQGLLACDSMSVEHVYET